MKKLLIICSFIFSYSVQSKSSTELTLKGFIRPHTQVEIEKLNKKDYEEYFIFIKSNEADYFKIQFSDQSKITRLTFNKNINERLEYIQMKNNHKNAVLTILAN